MAVLRATYQRHPLIPTDLGMRTLRARLSLRETQPQFAQRFKVSHITVHKWETGKVAHMQRIYKAILDSITQRLKDDGRWMSDEIFNAMWASELSKNKRRAR